MNWILSFLANATAFCCAMNLWQFNFPPRLFIYDLLSLAFIFLSFVRYFSIGRIPRLKKELQYVIAFQWVYLFVVLLSGARILFWNVDPEVSSQYTKGLLSDATHAFFVTFFVLYLSWIKPKQRETILNFFIWGVIASCIYGVFQMFFLSRYGIDLDYFWERISYRSDYDFTALRAWAVRGVFRGRGFAGVNSAATYIVTVMPLFLLGVFYLRRNRYILFTLIGIIGLCITMSRTGFVAFTIAVLVLLYFERHRFFRTVISTVMMMIPLVALAFYFWPTINEILRVRSDIDYERLMLYQGGLTLFLENPFLGIGANTYSVVRTSLPSYLYQDLNLHNSWLTILIQLGAVGLILNVTFFIYMICAALTRKTLHSKAFVAALIGLSAGGLFNQVFDSFYFIYYMALTFSIVILDDGRTDAVK